MGCPRGHNKYHGYAVMVHPIVPWSIEWCFVLYFFWHTHGKSRKRTKKIPRMLLIKHLLGQCSQRKLGGRWFTGSPKNLFLLVGKKLDDGSPNLYHGKMVGNHHFHHPLNFGCLGCQVDLFSKWAHIWRVRGVECRETTTWRRMFETRWHHFSGWPLGNEGSWIPIITIYSFIPSFPTKGQPVFSKRNL